MTREPTGDLTVDLVGAWKGTTDSAEWHHPIAYMAALPDAGYTGHRIWMFRADGTGHVWWVLNNPGISSENDEEFVWEVVDGELVVNDFRPATMEMLGDNAYVLHPIDESIDPGQGVAMHACDIDLPEGVRGFNASE